MEHSDGRETRIALTPDRPVAELTRERAGGGGPPSGRRRDRPEAAGGALGRRRWMRIDEHASYDPDQVGLLLRGRYAARRWFSPPSARSYRGRRSDGQRVVGDRSTSPSTFFSGQPADPPSDDFIMRNSMDSQEVAVGWWPGDPEVRPRCLLCLRASQPGRGRGPGGRSPQQPTGSRSSELFVLDWADVREAPDPHALALEFAHSAFHHVLRPLRVGSWARR